jgi:hypothetical protein
MDTIIGNEDFLILIAKDDGISKVTSNLFTINDSNFVNREDIDDINLKGNNPNAPAPEIETNVDLRYTEVEVTEVLEF